MEQEKLQPIDLEVSIALILLAFYLIFKVEGI
ncbi:hypothetical protein N207_08520 [Helicobacter pylori UM114]|uniref:Uncharacterized protein n=1 Tax=Helicobacter pylori UM114 TaxID=1355531 RepID=T0ETH9_HELPX|nr:hypothetical protein N207_08520 [Helicobacter pylori UM114]